VRQYGASQRCRGEEVQFEQRPQLIVGCLLNGSDLSTARVVHEHVNTTKAHECLLDCALSLARISHV
jgi:hypothetical protein